MSALDDLIRKSRPSIWPTFDPRPESALCFFSAAFLGVQDVVHFRSLDRVACVDLDGEKLCQMRQVYARESWLFVVADAFEARRMLRPCDVVVCDPYTGPLMRRTHDEVDGFAQLAQRHLVIGSEGKMRTPTPVGFALTRSIPRSSFGQGVYWDVFERTC